MNDLRAIGRVTRDEYSMYTLKGQRTIIKGYGNEIFVKDAETAQLFLSGHYGRWSGHTHPPGYLVEPSIIDRRNIPTKQLRSAIWGEAETPVLFHRIKTDDIKYNEERVRAQMAAYFRRLEEQGGLK